MITPRCQLRCQTQAPIQIPLHKARVGRKKRSSIGNRCIQREHLGHSPQLKQKRPTRLKRKINCKEKVWARQPITRNPRKPWEKTPTCMQQIVVKLKNRQGEDTGHTIKVLEKLGSTEAPGQPEAGSQSDWQQTKNKTKKTSNKVGMNTGKYCRSLCNGWWTGTDTG